MQGRRTNQQYLFIDISKPSNRSHKVKMAVTDKAAPLKAAPPLLDWMSLTKQLHHCWIGCHWQSSSTTVGLDVTDKAAPPLLDWMSLTKQLQICDLYKIMGNTTCIAPLPRDNFQLLCITFASSSSSSSSSASHNRRRAPRHSRTSSDCSHAASFCCRVERGCLARAFRSWKRGNAAKLRRGSVTPKISHLQCMCQRINHQRQAAGGPQPKLRTSIKTFKSLRLSDATGLNNCVKTGCAKFKLIVL